MKVETEPNLFEEFIAQQEGNNPAPIIPGDGITSEANDFLKTFGEQSPEAPVETPVEVPEVKDPEETPVETPPENPEAPSEEDDDSPEISYKAIVENAAELGILDFEDSDDISDDPDVLYNTIKKTIDNGINEYKDSLNKESKAFLEYLENGGDPRLLIQAESTIFDLESADLSDEETQKEIIKSYLISQEFTQEEIEEQIAAYEDGLLLEKQAILAKKKLEKLAEREKASILEEQQNAAKQQRDNYTNYINSVEKIIKESKEIAGLAISDKEKAEFEKYLLKADKTGKTAYSIELEKDPIKTQIELAYLKFKNYDFKNVATKAKSEATKELKKIFKSNEKTTVGKTATQKQTDDFSAFKSMWNK